MNLELNPPAPAKLLPVTDADRVRLGEALQALLAHGSILGLDPAAANSMPGAGRTLTGCAKLRPWRALDVRMEHESRLIQAVPEQAALTLHLRQDATIVLLALWYEYDTQVRDQGAAQVRLSVEQLNQLLKEKLLPDLKSQPSSGRM